MTSAPNRLQPLSGNNTRLKSFNVSTIEPFEPIKQKNTELAEV